MKEIKVELTMRYSESLPWDDVAVLSYIERQLEQKDVIEVTSIKEKEENHDTT